MAGHGPHGGTVSRTTANNKLTKLYWPSLKRSPKRLIIVLLEPKSGRHDKKFFSGALRRIGAGAPTFALDRCPPPTFKFVPAPLMLSIIDLGRQFHVNFSPIRHCRDKRRSISDNIHFVFSRCRKLRSTANKMWHTGEWHTHSIFSDESFAVVFHQLYEQLTSATESSNVERLLNKFYFSRPPVISSY